MEILRQIKEMEDALGGCPCEEPGKLNFLKEIKDRLDRMERDFDGETTTGDTHPITE